MIPVHTWLPAQKKPQKHLQNKQKNIFLTKRELFILKDKVNNNLHKACMLFAPSSANIHAPRQISAYVICL